MYVFNRVPLFPFTLHVVAKPTMFQQTGFQFTTQQTNDVMLMSYLAAITKGLATTSEVRCYVVYTEHDLYIPFYFPSTAVCSQDKHYL